MIFRITSTIRAVQLTTQLEPDTGQIGWKGHLARSDRDKPPCPAHHGLVPALSRQAGVRYEHRQVPRSPAARAGLIQPNLSHTVTLPTLRMRSLPPVRLANQDHWLPAMLSPSRHLTARHRPFRHLTRRPLPAGHVLLFPVHPFRTVHRCLLFFAGTHSQRRLCLSRKPCETRIDGRPVCREGLMGEGLALSGGSMKSRRDVMLTGMGYA